MPEFVRFPHTPHLAWLGAGAPRHDKVLDRTDVQEFLSGEVSVEEKVDGANVGLSLDPSGNVRAQNRGTYIDRGTAHPQFGPLFRWIADRQVTLRDNLSRDVIVFGEWCYAVHSVKYTLLPDWFLVFDVYDRSEKRFWNVTRRNALADDLTLFTVPEIAKGRFSMSALVRLLGTSRLAEVAAEGIYIRRDEGAFLAARAKLVAPAFTQSISQHWASRKVEPNRLVTGSYR